jgi:hypothetical protein
MDSQVDLLPRQLVVNKALLAHVLLLTVLPLVVLFLYRSISGPTYLSDEVGYLTKAAALAGFEISLVSQWHVGYSLVLAPILAIGGNPGTIWPAVVFLNGVFLSIAVESVRRILTTVFPMVGQGRLLVATWLAILYPGYLVISGHAFASSMYVALFSLTILAFVRASQGSWLSLLVHGLLNGFLYWVHPIALGSLVISVLMVFLTFPRHKRSLAAAVSGTVSVGLAALYNFVVHDYVDSLILRNVPPRIREDLATSYDNYDVAGFVANRIQNIDRLLATPMFLASSIAAASVATAGLFLFAVTATLGRGEGNPFRRASAKSVTHYAFFVALGTLAIGSFRFAGSVQPHYLFYLRYFEMVAYPLIALGLVATFLRLGSFTVAALSLVPLAIVSVLNDFPSGGPVSLNYVTVIGLWPNWFDQSSSPLQWALAGLAGMIVLRHLGLLATSIYFLTILIVSLSVLIPKHQFTYESYSSPGLSGSVIREAFPRGSCVGIEPVRPRQDRSERRQALSYWLFDYSFRPMSFSEWQEDCEGPYLSFSDYWVHGDDSVFLWLRDPKTGLSIVHREPISAFSDQLSLETQRQLTGSIGISESCRRAYVCVGAENLFTVSGGRALDGEIIFSEVSGVLVYGPYFPFSEGAWTGTIVGTLSGTGVITVDIFDAGRGEVVMEAEFDLSEGTLVNPSVEFELSRKVALLEMRIFSPEPAAGFVSEFGFDSNFSFSR